MTHALAAVQSVHFGKVRNSLVLSNERRILHTTNRISAFDVLLPFEVPGKGEILQALSTWFFQDTAHIVPNHLVGCLGSVHVLAREALVLPFEFVVRGVLTGSLWRLYETKGAPGVREVYGVSLPHGLARNAVLPEPVLTPTTKAESGHDKPLSEDAMVPVLARFLREKGLTESFDASTLLAEVKAKAFELFAHGREVAAKRSLVLVDTKYEFGLAHLDDVSNLDPQVPAKKTKLSLVLVDEVHTPDSSRYWLAAEAQLPSPRQLSKEFLREELIARFGNPDAFGPDLAHHPKFQDAAFVASLAESIGKRYREMFSLFLPDTTPFEVCQKTLVPWPLSPVAMQELEDSLRLPSKILVVGNGGRDWSLFDFFARLPEVTTVYCAPGKRAWDKVRTDGKYRECPHSEVQGIARFAKENGVGLVVSGPELPLCQGLQEACSALGVACLGPNVGGASLEASKVLCKELACAANIPGAAGEVYGWKELQALVERFLAGEAASLRLPCALKFDGLASGKGVFICRDPSDVSDALSSAREHVPAWERQAFGLLSPSATKTKQEAQFLAEELLEGDEISVLALCNGTEFRLLPFARDYKRRDDGQSGPNTGGMGSVCPVDVSASLQTQVNALFSSALSLLASRGTPYSGFLFAGIMVDASGKAWLLEFNCRLGDPETQSVLPGLGREFAMELFRTAQGLPFALHRPQGATFEHDGRKRVYVVGAAPEYPQGSSPARSFVGPGFGLAFESPDVALVPSAIEPDGRTRGGRAFGYLGTGETFGAARARAYAAIKRCVLGTDTAPHFRRDVAAEFEDVSP
ncbi:MAG: hypothetical protein IOD12_05420 [Silvanigrellales bacterium]|nr:hypothetical protein [Silvanigrellales bacterium]